MRLTNVKIDENWWKRQRPKLMERKIDENRWNQPKPTIDEHLMKIDEDWRTLKFMTIDKNCRSSTLMKNADTKRWWKLMKLAET